MKALVYDKAHSLEDFAIKLAEISEPTLRELDPVGSPDPTGPQSFLFGLLDGDLNADRLHHHPIPPGRGPIGRARVHPEVAI